MRKFLISILLVIVSISVSGQMMLPGVVASSRQTSSSTLNNGLIARWDLDESTGTLAVEEVNGHDATLYGSIGHSTDAVTGYALDFSGATGQYGSAANHADFQVSTTVSVSLYVKFDAVPGASEYTYFLSYSTSGAPYQAMHVYRDGDGAIFFAVYNTSGTKYYARTNYGYSLSTGVWYHIVGVCPGTGGAMTLYINETNVVGASNTLTGTIYQFNGPVYLGANANTFNGRMDNIRIYDRELTTAEISELYDELP